MTESAVRRLARELDDIGDPLAVCEGELTRDEELGAFENAPWAWVLVGLLRVHFGLKLLLLQQQQQQQQQQTEATSAGSTMGVLELVGHFLTGHPKDKLQQPPRGSGAEADARAEEAAELRRQCASTLLNKRSEGEGEGEGALPPMLRSREPKEAEGPALRVHCRLLIRVLLTQLPALYTPATAGGGALNAL